MIPNLFSTACLLDSAASFVCALRWTWQVPIRTFSKNISTSESHISNCHTEASASSPPSFHTLNPESSAI